MIFSTNSKSDLKNAADMLKENEPTLNIDFKNSEPSNNNQLWLKKTFKKYYFKYFINVALPEKTEGVSIDFLIS